MEDVAKSGSVSSPNLETIEQEETASSCTHGGLNWLSGKNSPRFFTKRVFQALEQASQGSGEISILGHVLTKNV